jgi:hypothetical protein
MLVALPELHKVLQGKPCAEMLQQWVTDTSGLPLPLLQHLYRKRPQVGVNHKRQVAGAHGADQTVQLSEQ